MTLNTIEQLLYSFVAGLSELLPVSSSAHSILVLKLLGSNTVRGLPMLLIHLGILLAIYTLNLPFLVKMYRARKLSLIPKKKRKRPLDVHSLLDLRFLSTLVIPVIAALLFYGRISSLRVALPVVAIIMFINGSILYVPQFFATNNKDSRSLTRAEGVFMGMGAALGVVPGLSLMAGALSTASVCGIERAYAQTMAQLLEMVWLIGMIIYDIADIINYGFGYLTLQTLLFYLLAGVFSFAAARIGIRLLKSISNAIGYHAFGFYCWGVSFFIFILNLLA